MRVHLWDLSGSPEYIDVRNELYGQSDAIFLVFDVTNQASFESLDTWMKEVNKYSGGCHEIILVANKVRKVNKYSGGCHEIILVANKVRMVKHFMEANFEPSAADAL